MANFYPWIDTSNTNVMSANDFKNDSQRTTGFEAGQAASAKRVNSALRQANLFVAALANVILGNDTSLNLTSSLNSVQTKLESSFPFDLKLRNKEKGCVIGSYASGGVSNRVRTGTSSSFVFGNGSYVGIDNSLAFGNTCKINFYAANWHSPLFQFGDHLTNNNTNNAKFVTGQYNTDCGECVRETGAGTSESNRKTVEKLDKDGTLYINTLALVAGNINEQTNVGNTATLNSTTLEVLNRIKRIYTSEWQSKSTGSSGYISLDEGVYLINVSKDTVFYDFGVVTLEKAGTYFCPYHALIKLTSESNPAAAWTYNVAGEFGVLISGETGRVSNVTVRYKKIGEAW